MTIPDIISDDYIKSLYFTKKNTINSNYLKRDLAPDKVETLSRILQNGNFCKITTMEQVEHYDEIVRQKYDEITEEDLLGCFNDNHCIEYKHHHLLFCIYHLQVYQMNHLDKSFYYEYRN